jgi:hypothetical protein
VDGTKGSDGTCYVVGSEERRSEVFAEDDIGARLCLGAGRPALGRARQAHALHRGSLLLALEALWWRRLKFGRVFGSGLLVFHRSIQAACLYLRSVQIMSSCVRVGSSFVRAHPGSLCLASNRAVMFSACFSPLSKLKMSF